MGLPGMPGSLHGGMIKGVGKVLLVVAIIYSANTTIELTPSSECCE